MAKGEPSRSLTRRQLIAGGLGLAATAATGGVLAQAWEQLGREDLVPGRPPTVALPPQRWETTSDRLTFAALGDNGSGGRQAMAVAEQMARTYRSAPFGLVSLLGDICYYGPISRRFDDVFTAPLGPLIDAGVQFELAVGNHDGDLFLGDDRLAEVERVLERLGTPARYYTVARGPVDFFYLDSGDPGLTGRGARGQLEWLDDALAQSTRRWRIVCLHRPIYSSGHHGETARLDVLLEPLLVRHGVDLVLAGHDHHYERSVPIEGVTHVVSGGGCKLTPVSPEPYAAVATSTLQFLHVEVVDDRLTGRSIGADGSVIDAFELRART